MTKSVENRYFERINNVFNGFGTRELYLQPILPCDILDDALLSRLIGWLSFGRFGLTSEEFQRVYLGIPERDQAVQR